jgi:arylsulfatase A-like enzyme
MQPLTENHAGMKNVLVLCIDCLRYDRLQQHLRTEGSPLSSELRSRGVWFDRAFSTAPWTYPATNSILTGLYPRRHGARHRGGYREGVDSPWPGLLDSSQPTIFSELKRHSYRTVGISTIYWALNEKCEYPGCDLLLRSAEQNVFYKNTPASWVVESFFDCYRDHLEGHPFFAYLHFMDLHRPYNLEVADQHTHGDIPSLEGIAEWDIRPHRGTAETEQRFRSEKLRVYDALIGYVDEQLARLFEFLRARGVFEDTLIVITADHGEEFWEHEAFERANYSCGKKSRDEWLLGTGHGHTLFNELTHVPLIMLNGGAVIRASAATATASLIDIFPTILDWTGHPIPVGLDGRSLRDPDPERVVFAEATLYGHERKAAFGPHAKCVTSPGDNHLAFYDLAADPLELNPLELLDDSHTRLLEMLRGNDE